MPQTGFTTAPAGISPWVIYLDRAMSSLRASATIEMRRIRPRSEPTRWRNQQLRALAGWYLTHIRGPRLHCLLSLLPARHAGAAPACAGAGADAARRAGEVCSRADDRRAPADHRWPRAGAHPLYRARTRAQPVAEETQTRAARSTAPQDHRGARAADPAVVPTFGSRPQQSQLVRRPKVLE